MNVADNNVGNERAVVDQEKPCRASQYDIVENQPCTILGAAGVFSVKYAWMTLMADLIYEEAR